MCFEDFFLQLQWHGNGCGCGSSCDLANFSDVSKSRVSDDTDLAHFIEGMDELSVEKEIRGGDLVELRTSCCQAVCFVKFLLLGGNMFIFNENNVHNVKWFSAFMFLTF